jgi:hypothetical protein
MMIGDDDGEDDESYDDENVWWRWSYRRCNVTINMIMLKVIVW